MQLVATTSLQARRPLWSTIAWKTWLRFFKHFAMKAATCLRRPMTQSTGSSGGSWIRKATRLNFGNHRPGNNPHARQQSRRLTRQAEKFRRVKVDLFIVRSVLLILAKIIEYSTPV